MLKLVWRNLIAHPLRSTLSALAVTLGVATIVAADVSGTAVRNAGEALAGSTSTVAFTGDMINNGLNMMGLVILATAGFLIYNAFAMAVTQQRQQIGALRSLGMLRGQVLRLVLLEALLIGGMGTALGLALGPLLGRGLLQLMAAAVGIVHGRGEATPAGLLQATATGVGVTLLATLLPARRATRIPPLAALRSQEAGGIEDDRRGPALLGLLIIALLAAVLLLHPPAATVPTPPWDFVLTGLFALGWLAGLALILPFLIGAISHGIRRLSQRGATLRLAADNLARARGRVLLTLGTLALSLMMIVSVTGVSTFSFNIVITQIVARYDLDWIIGPFPSTADGSVVNWEMLSQWDLSAARLPATLMTDLDKIAAGRARLVHVPQVIVPELAIMSGLPSIVADPAELSPSGLFTFSEGDWASARPIMESGCGLLLMPRMARKLDVGLYGTLTLEGTNGPVECTVAGLGSSSFMGTSIISAAAGPAFGLEPGQVFMIIVLPLPTADKAALRAELDELLGRYPNISLIQVDPFFEDAGEMLDKLQTLLNGMLLLAIFAAALGVINTTALSVNERRRELALLRAVGATRRQVLAIVAGEAAWMGLIGGALGLLAGVGLTAVYVVVNGGHMYGLDDMPLWSSAWSSIRPALGNGLVGLVAAPLICAGAAWVAGRGVVEIKRQDVRGKEKKGEREKGQG